MDEVKQWERMKEAMLLAIVDTITEDHQTKLKFRNHLEKHLKEFDGREVDWLLHNAFRNHWRDLGLEVEPEDDPEPPDE